MIQGTFDPVWADCSRRRPLVGISALKTVGEDQALFEGAEVQGPVVGPSGTVLVGHVLSTEGMNGQDGGIEGRAGIHAR